MSSHVLPHGSYLVNLAQEDTDKAKQAYDAFLDDINRCEALGIRLYNFQFVCPRLFSPQFTDDDYVIAQDGQGPTLERWQSAA